MDKYSCNKGPYGNSEFAATVLEQPTQRRLDYDRKMFESKTEPKPVASFKRSASTFIKRDKPAESFRDIQADIYLLVTGLENALGKSIHVEYKSDKTLILNFGFSKGKSTAINAHHIINIVSRVFKCDTDHLSDKSRVLELVNPRHCAMFLIRRYVPSMGASAIGRMFCRDHSTALFSISAAKNKIETQDELFYPLYEAANKQIIEFLNQSK